jgi:putative membrane protein
MLIFMLLWWGLLAAGIVWLVRVANRPADTSSRARQILDERFAAGEISAEEYEARRHVLERRT